jgi:hypothetical protein
VGGAAPLVSAAWSGAWNGIEMHRRLGPAVRATCAPARLRVVELDTATLAALDAAVQHVLAAA